MSLKVEKALKLLPCSYAVVSRPLVSSYRSFSSWLLTSLVSSIFPALSRSCVTLPCLLSFISRAPSKIRVSCICLLAVLL